MDHLGWVIAIYVVSLFVVVAFAGYALAYGWWYQKKTAKIADTETFITARNTQGRWRIGWSFFAGAVGAWVSVQHGRTRGARTVWAMGVNFQLPSAHDVVKPCEITPS